MTPILLLFAVAMIFFAVEIVIPGGILGALGFVAIISACVVCCLRYGAWAGLAAIATGLFLSAMLLYLEFLVLPKSKLGKRARLDSQVTGVAAAFGSDVQALVGLPAEAVTMLSPSGYITVQGQRFEAFCESGQAPVGAALVVTGADNFRLIVSKNPVPKSYAPI